MPYDMDSDNLPKHVQDMPEEKRKQWIEAFNSAYEDCVDDDGDPSDCDGEAMRIANASVSERLRTWINKLLTFLGFADKPDKTRAVSLGGVIDQVYSKLAEVLQDEYVWINDVYLDGDGTFLLCSSKGKLYRFRVEVSSDNVVSLGDAEEVVMDIQPSTSQEETGSDSDYDEYGSIQLSRFPANNMVIRQEGERYRWLSVSCVSVLNRAGEIDSSALFDSFVEYAERTGEYPIRQFYHAGDVFRTGKADFLARVGYALITSGLYDDTPLARAEVAARQDDPAYWGDSIGFVAEVPEMLEVQSGITVPVYKSGVLREISTLPEVEACAWFTNLTNVEVSRMNNRQFEAFVKLFGGDEKLAKKWLEDNPEALNRQILEGGMLARSQVNLEDMTDNQLDQLADGASIQDVISSSETVPPPPEQQAVELDEAAMQILIDRAVEQMQGNLVPLAEGLQTIQANWDTSMAELTRQMKEFNTALQAHASRLSGLEADKAETDRTRVMDMPKSNLKVTYRPRNGGAQPDEDKPADKAKVTLSKIKDAY